MLECVVNISEGRDAALLASLAGDLAGSLLDVHTDADHNRSVFTLVGDESVRRLTRVCTEKLSMEVHEGVHPRLGVVDVVPFVPLAGSVFADAVAARDRYARWVSEDLDVPVFLYGPERSLPTVRREAWRTLAPDFGPHRPHPTAGAVCAGAREPLVAYNVWLEGADLALTRSIAAAVRSDNVRTLGLQVGDFTQVSMNLVAPTIAGPAVAYDSVAAHLVGTSARIVRAELVGLVPADVLAAVPGDRREELDLSEDRTIEARLAAAGISR